MITNLTVAEYRLIRCCLLLKKELLRAKLHYGIHSSIVVLRRTRMDIIVVWIQKVVVLGDDAPLMSPKPKRLQPFSGTLLELQQNKYLDVFFSLLSHKNRFCSLSVHV